jgi:phosphomannomutase
MARDGLAAAVAVLELCATTGRPLSELAADLPSYVRRRSTIPCFGRDGAVRALEALATKFGIAVPDDPEVGICLDRGDGTWGLIRRSATEFVLRVTTESPTAAQAEELHEELVHWLTQSANAR